MKTIVESADTPLAVARNPERPRAVPPRIPIGHGKAVSAAAVVYNFGDDDTIVVVLVFEVPLCRKGDHFLEVSYKPNAAK